MAPLHLQHVPFYLLIPIMCSRCRCKVAVTVIQQCFFTCRVKYFSNGSANIRKHRNCFLTKLVSRNVEKDSRKKLAQRGRLLIFYTLENEISNVLSYYFVYLSDSESIHDVLLNDIFEKDLEKQMRVLISCYSKVAWKRWGRLHWLICSKWQSLQPYRTLFVGNKDQFIFKVTI